MGRGAGRLHSGAVLQDTGVHSAEVKYADSVLGVKPRTEYYVGGTVSEVSLYR